MVDRARLEHPLSLYLQAEVGGEGKISECVW